MQQRDDGTACLSPDRNKSVCCPEGDDGRREILVEIGLETRAVLGRRARAEKRVGTWLFRVA